MAVTLQGSTLNNIHIGNSGSGGGGAISAVNSAEHPVDVTFIGVDSYSNMPTPTSVSVATGTRALVSIRFSLSKTGPVASPQTVAWGSFSISGATTQVASDAHCVLITYANQWTGYTMSGSWVVENLNAGTNVFSLKIKTSGGNKELFIHNAGITVQTLA